MITVIVPIYNKKDTIEKCVKSILNQTYKNIEIILVNDGSDDGSDVVCNRLEKVFSSIRVIHQNNKGVSAARNIGLEKAKGKYIQFVDCDDYLDEGMCELLVNKIKQTNSDLIICGYKIICGNTIKLNKNLNKKNVNMNILPQYIDYLVESYLLHSPCNKLYLKDKILFYFDEELSRGEDLIFNLNYLKNIDTITMIPECPYNYIKSFNDSLSSRFQLDMFDNALYLFDELKNFCEQELHSYNNNSFYKVLLENTLSTLVLYINNNEMNFYEKISIINKIISYKSVRDSCQKVKKINFRYKMLNYLFSCKNPFIVYFLIKIYYK